MGRYQALRRLPQHPLATTAVFEVADKHDQRLKILKVLQEPTRSRIARLRQEYSALMVLNVPGQIPRPDLDGLFAIPTLTQPVHCLVMEKIEGQTLRQWIDAGHRCSQTMAIHWLSQIIEIVARVHDRFYLHRDIKPNNLILRPDGQLALIDFEACRKLTETYFVKLRLAETDAPMPGSTYSLTAVGSAGYMPPEQLHGGAMPQSDLFAIARSLIHAITGIHPTRLPITETGKLLWRTHAPQIDRPFADLLDELQAPNWRSRPADVPTILQRLDQLPPQIRRYRFLRSIQFRTGVTITSLITLLALAWGVQAWTVNQRFAQARQYVERGAIYQINGQLEAARQNYRQALTLNPTQIGAINNLAQLCREEGKFACAIEYYQQALRLATTTDSERKNLWKIHYNLGNVYDEQDDRDNAIAQYQLAIQGNPALAVDAMNNLARLENLQGNYAEAERLAKQALAQTEDPVSVASLKKNLGWSLLKQSQGAAALEVLSQAQQLNPSRTDIYCLLAQAQAVQGNQVESRQNWHECLRRSDNTARFPEVTVWRSQYLDRVDPLPKP